MSLHILNKILPFAFFASVKALEKVKISIQPAFHGIPIYAAKEYGWFEELGLDVELSLVSYLNIERKYFIAYISQIYIKYASGAPQVKAAVENEAWDIGIAGSVPIVLAGQQNILSIGINNDESKTTEVIGAPGVTEWPPSDISDQIFGGTPKSTGELLLRKCLVAAGLSFEDNHVLFAQQNDVMRALEEGTTTKYACLWAPNTYTYREENPRAEVFCSGKDIDFPIYGGLMVRKDYAVKKRQVVAKVLAAYLRGVTFMQNTELLEEVLKISSEYHEYSGSPLSENALREDLILRPLFNLDQQLDHMSRNFANNYESDADKHYIELEDFLFNQGVIDNKFLPKEYITDEYMKLVSSDPELRAFSYLGVGTAPISFKISNASDANSKMSVGAIVGIILGIFGGFSLVLAIFIARRKPKAPIQIEAGNTENSIY